MLKLTSESDIRTTSGVKYHDSQGDRTLRLIVTPFYTPLTVQLARHPDSLVTMVKQLIDCIHELRYSADVLHCDICQGSIMHRKSSEGADDFILVDFDLAAVTAMDDREQCGTGSFSPWNRLGTLPFMPYDLVVDIARRERNKGNPATSSTPRLRHCVRFDFESLFWVALWCSIRVTKPENDGLDGKDERDKYLALWHKGEYIAIANSKQAVMNNPRDFKSSWLSPAFRHLQGWLLAFMRPFSQAIDEKKNADWEYIDEESDTEQDDFCSYETGYGKVTRDTLMEALETYEAKRAAKRKAGSSRVG